MSRAAVAERDAKEWHDSVNEQVALRLAEIEAERVAARDKIKADRQREREAKLAAAALTATSCHSTASGDCGGSW